MVHMAKEDLQRMQIKRIEKEIRDTPFHKGTEHHIGKLRAKLSKIKGELDFKQSKKSGRSGGYAVKKQGDATVVLVGPPSVGKSTLLNKLTNANSKIAPYAFTTLTVIPGMMDYKHAKIQILDVPGIISDAEKGRGRGREVLSVARGADLVIIISDTDNVDQIRQIKKSLHANGIRLDQSPPEVKIEKKLKGGIVVHSNIKQNLDIKTIVSVSSEFGYKNAEITIREMLTMDRLIDAFSKNRVYTSSLSVINKSDLFSNKIRNKYLYISAEDGTGLDKLKMKIFEKLDFVILYLLHNNEKPNKNNPIIAKSGNILSDILSTLGTEMSETKTRAKIWGRGAKYKGQNVPLTTKIREEMIVSFV